MFTQDDAQWVKGNRTEITANRTTQITIVYIGEVITDEFTGEVIGGTTQTSNVQAIVTEISGGTDEDLFAGIKVEKGDVKLDVAIDDIIAPLAEIESVTYGERVYVIIAHDRKGLGIDNRVEMLGRAES